MGYNQDLEDAIDRLIDRLGDIAKKRMFGGVGYLINGNMCFGIHKESLVLRTSPEKAEEMMKSEYVTPFDITGKPMKGWVMIDKATLRTARDYRRWLDRGLAFARSLPRK